MLRGCTLRVDSYMYRCDTSHPITKATARGSGKLSCNQQTGRNKCEMLNMIEISREESFIQNFRQ